MEHRFTIKDFFIFLLLAIVILILIVKMVQDDRQWDRLRQVNTELRQHTEDLARIQRMLAQGITDGGKTAQQRPVDLDDAFARIRAAQQNPDYAIGDYFVDSDQTPPDKLTPIISSDLFSSTLQSFVLDSLLERDPDTLEWKGKVARAYKISPDGLRMEFNLREDVVFSDGQPLTADDIVWTYKWIMNDKVQAPRLRVYYDKIASVEQEGKYRVVFTFKEPYFKSLEVAAGLEIMPSHFYGQFTEEQFNTSVGLLMGSGPYRMADPKGWKPEPGRPVELIRNERFWGEPPPFDKLIWRIIENPAARLTAFRNGEIDRFGATPEQYALLLKDPSILEKAQNYEMMRPSAGYIYIGWNQKRDGKPTPFADKRVRQAMTMLINRQTIIDEILLGYGNIATGPFNPLGKQHNKDIQPWPYDPKRALALLREAGFTDRNNDGVMDAPDGQPFRFNLAYPSTSTTLERVSLLVQDSLKRAGVLGTPRPTEWSVMLKDMDERKFDAAILGWGGTLESDLFQIFHSSMMEGTGDNNVQYSNPELDKVIEQARVTVDEEKRNDLWKKAHAILHEDQPYTFMFNNKSLVFVDKRFRNVQRVTVGLNPIVEWYVPANLRKWSK